MVIYTYDWSPFSSEAKQLLDAMGADYLEADFRPMFGRFSVDFRWISAGVPGPRMVPGLAEAGGEARGAGSPLRVPKRQDAAL